MQKKMARVGVLFDKHLAERRWRYGLNVFEAYTLELLNYCGIPFQELDHAGQVGEGEYDVVIVALEDEKTTTAEKLVEFVEQGGCVISYAGLPKLLTLLDCRQLASAAAGYASIPEIIGESRKLRALNVVPWVQGRSDELTAGGQVKQIGHVSLHIPEADESCVALHKFTLGKGTIERWAVPIPTTIVGLQQGQNPVLTDGISALDGTGDISDGILKADDSIELDWEWDRQATEAGKKYFGHPYTDLWREVMISHLLQIVLDKGLTLPFIGFWPDDGGYTAHISFDSDSNKDIQAETTLDILKKYDVPSTWCMLEPGYSPYIYERARKDGHELAFHYNSLERDDRPWDSAEFTRQHEWFKAATGEPYAISNKNHFTRFEGWGDLFVWCEQNKIRLDQSRGSSKRGNVGFTFGTCHPYYPIAWANERNRLYDVLEVGFLTQDMDEETHVHSSVIRPFLEQVKNVDGVAHFLFHQRHIHNKAGVREAFVKLVETARAMGFKFKTAKQIDEWVRARRKVIIKEISPNGNVELSGGPVPNGLVVWLPEPRTRSGQSPQETFHKFNVPCTKTVFRA